MTMMTSAIANKLIKKLNDDKEYWQRKEHESVFYIAAVGEEPVIPEYDYHTVSDTIAEIDEKVAKIKHAINLANATSTVNVGGEDMTIDTLLVKMAQLNRRKTFLDNLRRQNAKTRISSGLYGAKNAAPEYQYINYPLEDVKADYERIDALITEMQMALDRYNQTVEFEVEV